MKISDLMLQALGIDPLAELWYTNFASALRMDFAQARELFLNHGLGMVYTSHGFVVPYHKGQPERLAKYFGRCVVVEEDARVWALTPQGVEHIKRKRMKANHKRKMESTRKSQYRDHNNRESIKKREVVFHDGMGRPCKKHQGKGDSLDDLGQYVYRPKRSMMDGVPRYVDRLITINIGVVVTDD